MSRPRHKKNSVPYIPWYHGDFMRSTVSWTLIEQAVYWKLLCAQWDGGALPNDEARLSIIAGTDPQTLANVWPIVGRKFDVTKGGLVNSRLESIREQHAEYRRKQRENGAKGGQANAQRLREARNNFEVIEGGKND